jgi:hypothetical protein
MGDVPPAHAPTSVPRLAPCYGKKSHVAGAHRLGQGCRASAIGFRLIAMRDLRRRLHCKAVRPMVCGKRVRRESRTLWRVTTQGEYAGCAHRLRRGTHHHCLTGDVSGFAAGMTRSWTTFLWRCSSPSVKAFASAMTGPRVLARAFQKSPLLYEEFLCFLFKEESLFGCQETLFRTSRHSSLNVGARTLRLFTWECNVASQHRRGGGASAGARTPSSAYKRRVTFLIEHGLNNDVIGRSAI